MAWEREWLTQRCVCIEASKLQRLTVNSMSVNPKKSYLRVFSVALALGALVGACDNAQDTNAQPQPNPAPEQQPNAPEPKKEEPKAVTGLGLGEDCKDASNCESGFCEMVLKRGPNNAPKLTMMCTECAASSDCPAERPHCTYDIAAQTKLCGDGSLGQLCSDGSQCKEGSDCALVNLGDNEVPLNTCAECTDHDSCTDPAKPLCITLPPEKELKPYNTCAAEGVRKDGDVCFPCETGDRECEGYCVRVKIPGRDFCIGVCGGCRTDEDCGEGEVCSAPVLNMGSDGSSAANEPSKCVPKG